MIYEPHICIQGPKAGEIDWRRPNTANKRLILEELDSSDYLCIDADGNNWQLYHRFEREKLKELNPVSSDNIGIGHSGYGLDIWYRKTKTGLAGRWHKSDELIGYGLRDYLNDSESSRLLKRAEFLKAVCEKEGVEWLPRECCCGETLTKNTVHRRDGPCYHDDLCHQCCNGSCGCPCHSIYTQVNPATIEDDLARHASMDRPLAG